ncbi:glucosylceramidase [Holotrichia oblita]|uniref:Glucosylceramidase n=1 Tax=Holotrichia oblita TaxID=644536 RepID=A0ACB9TKM7_HOLOL|nr:glucosylceramidase [Holotrichia oblita]
MIYNKVICIAVQAPLVYLSSSCISRDYNNGGTVCVCNGTYCDYIGKIPKVKYPQVLVYTSNMEGLRFQKTNASFQNISAELRDSADIIIESHRTYQKVFGFGGAFTDATGINVETLKDDAREHLMKSYFSNDGIQYNVGRVPIGGTDFSTKYYSYDDGEPDPSLKKFALNSADTNYKIPCIKVAHNLTHGKLKLIASAWTAPKWMKTNGAYHGGTLKPEMYQAWADYYVKFFNEYKKQGIKFWGVTTGNEPSLAKYPLSLFQKLASIGWTANTLAQWVEEALGPTLHKSGYGDLNIMALDDQRFYLTWFIDRIFKNEAAKNYINGTAVHWYFDTVFPAKLLSQLHYKYPDKFIISTEACKGFFLSRGVLLGSWSRGEDYAQDIIEDMRNWVIGWIDWNMALNPGGGPTFLNNVVDSPIVVNGSANEFYKQPMYYAMGHFSKFVPRDSVRIESSQSSKVWSIAFKRPDHAITVVLLNRGKVDQDITIVDSEKGTLTLTVSEHSITTLLYW